MKTFTKSSYSVIKDDLVYDFNRSDWFNYEHIRVVDMLSDSLPDATTIAELNDAQLVVVDVEVTPRIRSWP